MSTPHDPRRLRFPSIAALAVVALALAGCATVESPQAPGPRTMTAAEARALTARLLPPGLRDREGWATDLYAAVAALDLPRTPSTLCAASACH